MSAAFDFNKDLKRQKIDMHDKCLREIYKARKYDFEMQDPHRSRLPHVDKIGTVRLAGVQEFSFPIEFKADKYHDTGNIIIELLSYVQPEAFNHLIPGSRWSVSLTAGQGEYKKTVQAIQDEEWNGSWGLGLDPDIGSNHLFHYLYYDEKRNIPIRSFAFNASDVRSFIDKVWTSHDIVITRSRRGRSIWNTVCCRMPVALIAKSINHMKWSKE